MALEKIRPRVIDEAGNYTFNNVTATGNLVTLNANLGNVATANYIKTDNLQYANGVSWPIGGALTLAGSNTQVQFNNAGSFGSSANFVFDTSTNRLTIDNITANGAALTNLTGANVTGTVGNANFASYAGNITVAAQSNITSVGTLTSLIVTGNITSGNANLGNFVIANYFSGSGNNLSNIQASNITGAIAYATTANSVSGANVSGAVTYAGTANAVAGANVLGEVANATYAVNAGTAYSVSASNISGTINLANFATTANAVAGANVSGQVGNALVAGTVYTNAQPNITSVGTLSSLAVTGNISGANVSITGTTASTSKTTGALTVAGGVGISNDLTVGNSITVDNGSYGNVVVTQFASIFATGSGPNPRAIYQATAADGVAGIGIQAYSGLNGQIYSNTGFTFTTGATIRDKDFPTGGTTRATVDSTGLSVTGNITSTNANLGNTVTANYFIGSGNNLSNIQAANITGTVNLANYATTANAVAGANVSGEVSFAATANSVAGANVSGFVANANIANTAFAVAGANVSGAVSYATTANSVAGANVSGQVGNSLIAGTVYTNAQPNITSVGTLTSLSVTGDISSANLTLTGNLTVSGTTTTVNSTTTRVVDPIFELGGGANGASLSADDNKDRGLLLHYHTGTTARDAFIGWDDSNGEFGVGSNVTLTSEVVTWNSYGNLRANFLLGNGYYLTGIDQLAAGSADQANYISNGTSNINTPTSGGNITVGIGGTANTVIFTSTGVNIAGYANLGSGNLLTTGNANVGNLNVTTSVTASRLISNIATGTAPLTVTSNTKVANLNADLLDGYDTATANTANTISVRDASGNLSANFFTGNGYYLTGIDQLAAGSADVANSIANGTSNINTPTSGGNITVGIGGTPNTVIFTSTGVNIAGYATVVGNITGGNANLGNAVTANYFIGNGALLTGVDTLTVGNAGFSDGANYIANGTSNVNTPVVNGNITVSIGGVANTVVFTSTGMNVTGNITTAGSGGNLSGANYVIANYFTGTLTTAAQPNITSVGTLTSLAVTGNITSGNANLGNAVTANYFIGNGSSLTALTGANVSGFVPNANVANTAYSVAVANVSGIGNIATINKDGNSSNVLYGNGVFATIGTVSVATISNGTSNVNIPAVNGNITLGVAGNSNVVIVSGTGVNIAGYANITGNITSDNANLGNAVTANYFTGNFYGNANTAGTVTTNAQPNITSVGTLSSLTVGNASANTVFGNGSITAAGNIAFTGPSVSLGSIGNISITGGAANYFLKTDGTGNLSWSVPAGGGGGGTSLTYTPDTAPPASGNVLGDQWFNTATNILYEYINDGTGSYWVDVSSPSNSSNSSLVGAIAIKDEGSNLTNAVSSINFVGSAVTASNVGNAVTVTITADTISPFLLMGA